MQLKQGLKFLLSPHRPSSAFSGKLFIQSLRFVINVLYFTALTEIEGSHARRPSSLAADKFRSHGEGGLASRRSFGELARRGVMRVFWSAA